MNINQIARMITEDPDTTFVEELPQDRGGMMGDEDWSQHMEQFTDALGPELAQRLNKSGLYSKFDNELQTRWRKGHLEDQVEKHGLMAVVKDALRDSLGSQTFKKLMAGDDTQPQKREVDPNSSKGRTMAAGRRNIGRNRARA